MGWVANLSNGETIIEGKPQPGERTPWQALLQHCRDNSLQITGLRLNVRDVTVNTMPIKMCDGYFQAYEAERILWRGVSKVKQGVGSIIEDSVYITWVDIDSPNGSMNYVHQDIRPLSEVKIHTTLQN
jgi:hypothetical protein